ncbi:VOC family protein [Pseudalkalibacillus sp. Hm43]|uniref:VOC family protein n=1 Tax=Pseudalkalibacillus sp. Hm43 TaxID=3450742 RepID=UPI003F4274C9
MKFKVSKNIGFQVHNVSEAQSFYERVLGFQQPRNSVVDEVEFRTFHNNIFLIDGEENMGPVMELIVEDLSEAKDYLVHNGCAIVRWEGKGKDCYVRDPYGMVFNVWEDKGGAENV